MNWKSIIILFLCCLIFVPDGHAEADKKRRKKKRKGKEVAFKQGQIGFQVAGGTAFNANFSKSEYHYYGDLSYKKGFPFGIRAEYGLSDFLGAGLYFGTMKEDVTITDVTNPLNIHHMNHKFTSLGLRFTYHQKLSSPKLDPYAGIAAGLTMVKVDYTSDLNELYIPPMDKAGLGFSIHAGCNFYFTKNIGAFIEGGYAIWLPMLNFGLSVKI